MAMLVYQRVISLYKTLLLLILFFGGGDSSGKFVRIPMMCGQRKSYLWFEWAFKPSTQPHPTGSVISPEGLGEPFIDSNQSPLIFYLNISYLKYSQTKYDHIISYHIPTSNLLGEVVNPLYNRSPITEKSEIGQNPAGFNGPVLDSSSLIHCNQRCIDFASAKISKINSMSVERRLPSWEET